MLKSARLTLRELTAAQVAALLDPDATSERWIAGYPLPGTRNAAVGFARLSAGERRQGFGMYQLVRDDDGLVIGDMGFHRPPVDGVVEVGFSLAPAARGAGYAGEALGELVAWALCQAGVDQVVARTAESNTSSQNVLARAGFTHTGKDGDFERFARGAPDLAPAHEVDETPADPHEAP